VQRVIDDGDMLLYRALPAPGHISVGPFVFLDHYRHRSTRGIGDKPHPHAGIEVVSYLLEGGVEHRDSAGFHDTLGPGDAQFIRAGRGILHAEQPLGGRHGLQLWTSLPAAQKFVEPTYESFRAADIPRIELPGASVKVIAGGVAGVTGPMVLTTPTTFALVRLDPGATAHFAVDDTAELGLYVLEGGLIGPDRSVLGPGALALLSAGSSVTLEATDRSPAVVALIGGQPAERPILFSGPFVMDTQEHLARAKHDYSSGKMGRLDGVPF
jgi:redox-sensitive bicupin YhaK (pirin superfamily)